MVMGIVTSILGEENHHQPNPRITLHFWGRFFTPSPGNLQPTKAGQGNLSLKPMSSISLEVDSH
eukprot:5310599-Amphidinium_carterae.1